MIRLSLNGIWKLRAEFLDVGPERVNEVLRRPEGRFNIARTPPRHFPLKRGWMNAVVPGDVMTPLMEHGLLAEPLEKCNSLDCTWTKEFSWWYKRDVDISHDMMAQERVLLYFEMLDHKADIFVNGIPVGHHRNTFRPFEAEIKRHLNVGRNQIALRLTCGIEDFPETDSVAYYSTRHNSIADQRVYLRKPQFQFGWDWCHPVPTCGIGRNVTLTAISGARITAMRMDTLSIASDQAQVSLHFTLDNLRMESTDEAVLEYEILYQGKLITTGSRELYITGGLSYLEDTVTLPNPHLWWPNGYGDQALYEIRARIICRDSVNEMPAKLVGIRTLRLNQSKLPDGTRNFHFIINDVRIFCKGGNWVPADSLYLRVPASTYHTLVKEAASCNFNMLRMWGGGTYEPDCFYEYCDRYGILLMHDFMYSCAFYPDHLDWFLNEATLEAEYQTTRLAHHPCMAIWTGNNEIHESYTGWFTREELPYDVFYGAKIFNYAQPEAVRHNCPLTPYLPSSPFGGDHANSSDAGDAHVWGWMGGSSAKFKFMYELEAFDRLKTRFSSEYGFFGALRLSSVVRYHAGEPVVEGGDIWIHHGEFPRKRRSIDGGIQRNITCRDGLSMEDYLLFSGILQGCLYDDMAQSLRYKPYTGGDLIWMYNDCWPETGWTVIDYYLTRKVSFYYLRRAFAPCKLIMRTDGDICRIVGINETPVDIVSQMEYGHMTFSGEITCLLSATLHLPAHSSEPVMELTTPNFDPLAGFFFARPTDGSDTLITSSVRAYFRDLALPAPVARIIDTQPDGRDLLVTIHADTYIPVLHLRLPDDRIHLSDDFFEMLPGQTKLVRVLNSHAHPDLICPSFIPRTDNIQHSFIRDET